MSVIRFTNSFDRLTDAELCVRTSFIISQLQAAADIFPAPDPSLDAVQADLDAFTDASTAAATGDRLKIAIREQKKDALVETLHLLGAWCAYACKGNLLAAQRTGFTLARTRKPLPPIAKPENVQVRHTAQSGEMKISVDAVVGAAAYMYQYATDPAPAAESWHSVSCSQSKCVIKGLRPAALYYFRVVAIGRKTQVMYSDVVSRMAV